MAEEAPKEETKKEATEAVAKAAGTAPAGGGLRWVIVGVAALVVVAVSAATGTFVVKAMGTPVEKKAESATTASTATPSDASAGVEEHFSYVDFDPVTVTLNEPRVARYIRAAVVLAFGSDINSDDLKKAKERIETRKPEMKNWLTVYLSGCTLEDVRSSRNLVRIQHEIEQSFNDQLWHDSKPMIHHVLFKEFVVQ